MPFFLLFTIVLGLARLAFTILFTSVIGKRLHPIPVVLGYPKFGRILGIDLRRARGF